ncbi:hypothetical protein ACI8AC_05545 [Geodermatophilus sp. SYSU D00758]
MELLAVPERGMTAHGSAGVGLRAVARVLAPQDGFAVDVVRLAAGGRLGRHPTALWQLLVVVEGAGWVAGADAERRPVAAGTAALWAPGEEHETGSAGGLLAVVVQCRERPLPGPGPEEAR